MKGKSMNVLAKIGLPAVLLLAASVSVAAQGPVPTPTPTPTPTSRPEIRCEFGKDECTARIRVCDALSDGCERRLSVECGGSLIYRDSFLIDEGKDRVLIQGITSDENPTPPAVVIKADHIAALDTADDGLEARLFTSFGSFEGRCREEHL
jgi:hypothetical protein